MADKAVENPLNLSKKKALLTGAVAVVLAGAAIALIGQVADFDKITRAFRHADKWWFIACLLGELLAYQGYIFAYRDFSRANRGPKLNWWEVTRVVGVGLGAFIVGSSAAGLAVDYWALKRAGARTHESARRVLALNTMEWAALAIMATLAAIAVLLGAGKGAPLYLTISWIAIVPLCFLAAYWFINPERVKKFVRLPAKEPPDLHWSPRSWLGWTWGNIRKGFADAIGGVVLVRHVMSHPLRYKAGNLGFFLYWIGDLLCLYAALQAYGYAIDPAPLILAYATTYLITILPLPAGGAGGMEAALTYTLHLVGVPLAEALAAAITFRFFTFWLPIGPALAFLPTLKGLAKDLAKTDRDSKTPRVNRPIFKNT